MADPIIFVIFLHGHKSNPMIPAAFFSTHLDGKHQSMKLNLTSDASNKTWEVKLDGRSFGDGWEDFSAVHCLRDDDVLVFRDKGDMSFHVTPSGRSFCPVQCIFSEEDDIWDDGSDSKNIASKKKPRMEAESSSENSYLVAHVTSSNLSRDTLCLLRGFSRSNGLNERCCDLDLMNQHGKTWTLGLRYNRTNDQACIRGGWRDFCFANGLEAGSLYRFKLVQNGTRPLLRLCSDTIPKGSCSKANGKHHLSEKSSSDYSESASMKQNKFLTITFKPYMLNSGQLRLPRHFARENEIKEAGEITLVDKYGVKWPSYLAPANEQGEFYMAKGWRSFCSANRLETGESFTLEFVRGEGTTPMLKFCSKAKIEQAPFDNPRGTGQASWDEEEEGQEETENRVQKRARLSGKGGPPSRRSLALNKSSDDPGNLQSKQPLQHCSISDQLKKVKQSIVVTLSGVRRIQLELEIKEQNLEASLEEINALEEKVLEINKIFNSHKI